MRSTFSTRAASLSEREIVDRLPGRRELVSPDFGTDMRSAGAFVEKPSIWGTRGVREGPHGA